MTYLNYPQKTILTPKEFIRQMNLALADIEEADDAMVVCSNDSGYWLEKNGVEVENSGMILSLAREIVLGIPKDSI